MEEHYAVVKCIPSLPLFKQGLIPGWRVGGNEQNTCSLRSFYAAPLQGGKRSLLELCLRSEQVGFSKRAMILAAYNMEILGITTA